MTEVCARCGWLRQPDPLVTLAEMNRLRDEFTAAHPQIYCPGCRKRLSPVMDSIDAAFNNPTVRMSCHHCGHHFEVGRQ